MSDQPWVTHLSYTTEDGIQIRGYNLLDLIGTLSFPATLYLLFTGEVPTPEYAKLIDAIMVASIDHGPGAPSSLAARTAASGGAPLGSAAAAGLLTIGKYHGGAVEDSMIAIQRVHELWVQSDKRIESLMNSADVVVEEYKCMDRRIAGYGHRQHKKEDPRVDRLFNMARESNVEGFYLECACELENALKRQLGRNLPINIDGAIAAILCELKFPTTISNALFMVSRLAGIIAHAHEEIYNMTPMRRIDPQNHSYSGPEHRNLTLNCSSGEDHD